MTLFLAVILIMFLRNGWTFEENCDGVVITKNKEEILRSHLDFPYQLAIDYQTNTLFFSYNNILKTSHFDSVCIDLKSNDFKVIKGIEDGFAAAVDNEKHIVYLGGDDGLYKFNYDTDSASHINGTNHNIWQLYFKKELYYITYPEQQVYIFKDGESKLVPELINIKVSFLAVGDTGDIYFTNESGLFIYEISKKNTSYIDNYNLHGFTNDIKGNLMFANPKGIYRINQKSHGVEKIVSLEDVYGVAIESDGSIIYSNKSNVIRLKSIKVYCPKDTITRELIIM